MVHNIGLKDLIHMPGYIFYILSMYRLFFTKYNFYFCRKKEVGIQIEIFEGVYYLVQYVWTLSSKSGVRTLISMYSAYTYFEVGALFKYSSTYSTSI